MAKWIAKFSVTVALVSLMACGGGSGGGGNNGGNGDNNPPAISVAISPATSQTMVAGQAQNFTATVTNDSASKGVTWSVSGTGCTGSACGSFTNTTATAATYNAPSPVSSNLIVTVLATSAADTTKTASVAVTVVPEPSVTTTSLSDAVQSSAYTATLAATGGIAPLTWSISAGNLPAGLTLAGSTGVISGTPTTLGTSNFTVQVADASNPPVVATKALSITVGPAPLTITTTSLPSGAVNSSYSATLAATGGTPPITWSISSGTLPTGLTLHSSTGVIDGTPTVADTSSFTVTATDAAQQTKSQALSIVVKPILSITTTTLPNGTVSSAYSATLLSDGGTAPITWTVTSGTLPQGLTLNGATGVISGTPTTEGTANFTITATDSSTPVQTASAALSITIVPAPLTITTTTLPDATLGSLYSTVLLTSGGTNPITWSVTAGSLPAWASLDPQTGTISGTPSGSPGVATFTVKATDSGNPVQTATQSLSITTLNGGVNNAELNGKYAFTMRGFDTGNSNFIVMAGSFSADGAGNITGGVMDVNSETGGPENLAISGGTYSVGADNRGMLTLSTQQGNSTYAISLGSISSGVASLGHIVSTDARILSGVLKKQDTTAFGLDKFNGFYAFGMNGQEHGGGYFASVGRLDANGAGAFTGNVDANDAGTVNPNQSIAGTYAVADATNGRLTLTDTTDGTHMAMYVVSAREFMLVNIDASGSPLSIGTVLEQSGSFSNASMNGVSVMWLQGNTSPTTSEVQLGFFTANGSGNFTLSQDKNDGGTVTSGTQSGTYSISGTGRMTVSAGSGAPIIYLVSPNQGFLMGTDSNVEFGYFEPQLASTFTNASISGNYMFGDQPPELNGSNVKSGVVTADGNGAISGTVDSNKSGTFATSTLTDNYSVASNGRATLSESVLYLISPSKGFMIQVDSGTKPVVTTVEK